MIRRDPETGIEFEVDDGPNPFAGCITSFDEYERKRRQAAQARQDAGLAPDPEADKPSPEMLRR
jgi:hypothetical protein